MWRKMLIVLKLNVWCQYLRIWRGRWRENGGLSIVPGASHASHSSNDVDVKQSIPGSKSRLPYDHIPYPNLYTTS
jgi:hypothetical protein